MQFFEQVQLCPRHGLQSVLFTPRLVLYHQTYAVCPGATDEFRNILCIWDESVSGRKAPDIASTVWAFLEKCDPNKPVIIWADNCGGQVS